MGCDYSRTSPITQTEILNSMYISGRGESNMVIRSRVVSNPKGPYIILPRKYQQNKGQFLEPVIVKEPPTVPIEIERFYVINRNSNESKKSLCKVVGPSEKFPNLYTSKYSWRAKKPTLSLLTRKFSSRNADHGLGPAKTEADFENRRLSVAENVLVAPFSGKATKSRQFIGGLSSGEVNLRESHRLNSELMNARKPTNEISCNLSQTSLQLGRLKQHPEVQCSKWMNVKEPNRRVDPELRGSFLAHPSRTAAGLKGDRERVRKNVNNCENETNTQEQQELLRNTPGETAKATRSFQINEILRKKFISRQIIQASDVIKGSWFQKKVPEQRSCSSLSSSDSHESPFPVQSSILRKRRSLGSIKARLSLLN